MEVKEQDLTQAWNRIKTWKSRIYRKVLEVGKM